MKKLKYKVLSLGALALLGMTACTRDFNEYNSQYSQGLGDEQLKADFVLLVSPFKEMQRNLAHPTSWIYQLQSNLNADMYSGLFSTATPYNGGRNNTTYFMMDGWNERIMQEQIEDIFGQTKNFKKVANDIYPGADFSHSLAILNILKVIAAQKVSDAHGPVIYSKFETPNPDGSTDFDSQQQAYMFFISDLSQAITVLQKTIATEDQSVITKSDLVFGGNVQNWVKLANSMKLRIAMRMSYADPANSKKYAEEALSSSAGLIETNDANALVKYGGAHPINNIIYSWGDCKIGAPLMAYMNGFKDPRISAYAQPATDDAVKGQYIGVRQGVDLGGSTDRYGKLSLPIAASATGDYFSGTDGKNKVFTAAETWFLKAEAAVRGYAGAGDAKTNYERGIQTSFDEWGKGSGFSDYIKDATSTEAPYIDPKNSANNISAGSPMLSTITIKWNDSDSFEKKLERIITQKWISLYPNGPEAWAEQRRTGYPILFQNSINDSQGAISTTAFIRRIPIPNKYRNNNPTGYQKAVATLGGPDTGGTKLWWDKK
ncbi:SusD/RagB family nutrient-binding outer membrane lipoprotein [Elizabethkingia meningoseptica]|uniref:SusD/RagB family nutrient-binding outer membrane lipoprotein n=1 Tax=Elizabethkingia meningoseptica TaxID=238 RepID=UPI0023AF2075|nr:SusD/RagB family nutrient-binding outer membrane lipoprotein [Elizabethkingia meningoseptica]MDE5438091.1 SusD/RagB family nutrient-binding outer membrane lipoprotein [Elizabethkingia meningoseptica]MDE5508634.1 SusD/RagB family nutrient-binding outer membrane lipoprotein [Elizabethkingia meningoseptica]MDE5515907.1 SusD/RagB family nutrient-binding outer membrane lipoprotein [Elizabethkingia meningoseptica]MDE5527017.1 SusD/RagB family nutrient-binding outer membrane lipoprotein [Elizabethk